MSWFKSSRQTSRSHRFKAQKIKPLRCPSRRLELEALETRLMPATMLDLTTAGSSGMIGGALFTRSEPLPISSGPITSFVRIQNHSAVVRGYNTNYRPLEFDENTSATLTRAVKVGGVGLVTVNGVRYRQFILDVSPQSSTPAVSMDTLRIYVGSSPNLTGYDDNTKRLAGIPAVYDLDRGGDNYIKLNPALNPASGSKEMYALIPDDYFVGASVHHYVYLYSRFGSNHATNGGYEEWSTRTPVVALAPPPLPSLSGYVYSDRDNNGVKTLGEVSLGGVSVTLTGTDFMGQSVNLTTTTNAGGRYDFNGLLPGTYTLTETSPSAYFDGRDTIGTPGGNATVNDVFSSIVLKAGVKGVNNNFGELLPASLAGFAYSDVNNDGIKQGSEPGISGVTVTLTGTTDRGDAVNLTTTTIGGGMYLFSGLRPGTYRLTETTPAGYLDGKERLGTPGGSVGNDFISNIVLKAGLNGVNNNFGELLPSSLSGFVYADTNNDGINQGADPGIAGVKVTLTGTNDLGKGVFLTTTTTGTGAYTFANLRPGSYKLTEGQPAAYLDGKDSVGTSGGIAGNDALSFIVLPTNRAAINYNFGELVPASLAGFVYVDSNNDGIKQGSELGIFRATITLSGIDDRGGVVRKVVLTGSDGAYSFTGLRPGTYNIIESYPSGYLDGKDTMGTPGGTAGNNVFIGVVLHAGVHGVNNNFGELLRSSLTGYVYFDANNDGTKQAGEFGIVGVTVTLTGTDDLGAPVSRTIKTSGNGAYTFGGLRPGTYQLAQTQPSGYLDGKDTIGSLGGTAANNVFSNIVLASGSASLNNNFGELKPASLGGSVFADTNNDGIRAFTELGISGVTVTLTGTDDLGAAVSLTATTNTSGLYTFSNLRPSNAAGYTITETGPASHLDGKDKIGTQGGTMANDVLSAIVLNAGVVGVNNTFGELKPARLSGFVYEDANNDSYKNSTETIGIGGVTVTLTGTNDRGDAVNVPATTDSSGAYGFTWLRPGTYTVTEPAQPSGYLDGKDMTGTHRGIIGNDTLSGINLSVGAVSANYNFGELVPASLGGWIYVDLNNDGIMQPSESPGLGGVTVTLTGWNDLGAPVSLTTASNATGGYEFLTLRPGSYTIKETQPAGHLDGKETLGNVGGVVVLDYFTNIVLWAGSLGDNYNFGELPPTSLGGFVYADINNNGSLEAGEAGIAGVKVTLTGTNDLGVNVGLTATTTSTGAYTFANLRPGTYTLTESQPAAFLDGKDTLGTAGGTAANEVFSSIVLPANTAGDHYNFGELPPASLAGFVYSDSNNDGIKQAAEIGIHAVTLTLTGTDDLGAAVSKTALTAPSGAYAFVGLRPGLYAITETQPTAYLDGNDTLGTPGGIAGNDVFSDIVVGVGVAGADNNFGDLTPASLSGFVFADANNDGLKQFSEQVLSDVIVTLTGTTDRGDTVNLTTATNAAGAYSFLNLRPGTYALSQTQPANYHDGKDVIGTQGGTTENDRFSNIVLLPGVHGITNDFCELPRANLSGHVYADANNNGRYDANETGINDATITLTGTDLLGNPVNLTATTNTRVDPATGQEIRGAYVFANLYQGTYVITETQPAAFLDGKDTIGTLGGTTGDDAFSNVVLSLGIDGILYNFGELPPAGSFASLSGFVYHDLNNDGVKQVGEIAISSVFVTLTGTDALGAVNRTAQTDGAGAYNFPTLLPGTYTLTEIHPAAYLDGKDSPGSLGGGATGDSFSNLVISSAAAGTNYNFGELLPASLAGFVYDDVSLDGGRQADEPGIGGVTVQLTGTDDLGGAVNQTATTTPTGAYSFLSLRPGIYTLTETQAAGYADGNDTIGTLGGTVHNDSFSNIVLSSGVTSQNNNFGELVGGDLAGHVYHDLNSDGIPQVGEAGISGVQVMVTGTDALGNAVARSTTTDNNGAYSFLILPPGTYTLIETQPAGYLDGLEHGGSLGGTVGHDVFHDIALASLQSGVNYSFGEILPATLGGHVYADLNQDGVIDSGTDSGLSDVVLTLTGTDDRGHGVSWTTTTSSTGAYWFVDLRPGMYQIAQTQPSGMVDGHDSVGTLGGTLGNDLISNILVVAGANGVNYDFTEVPAAGVSGFVYVDANNDGVRQPGESGIWGAHVVLSGTNDLDQVVELQTWAEPDGSYAFSSLRPGTYTLTQYLHSYYLDGKDTLSTQAGPSPDVEVTSSFVLAAGVHSTGINFGEILSSSLSGHVYFDENDDGVFQESESALLDYTGFFIILEGTDDLGNFVQRMTTVDANGSYVFLDLRPGTYQLHEVQPQGFVDGKDTAGNLGGVAASTTDGEGNLLTLEDLISEIALHTAGMQGHDYNFGEGYQLA